MWWSQTLRGRGVVDSTKLKINHISIICWNVRGLNNPDRWVDVDHVISNWNSFLVALLETKVHLENLDNIRISKLADW